MLPALDHEVTSLSLSGGGILLVTMALSLSSIHHLDMTYIMLKVRLNINHHYVCVPAHKDPSERGLLKKERVRVDSFSEGAQ